MEVNAEANAALSRATKEVNDGLSQVQKNFALARQMFEDQLKHDLEALEVSFTEKQSFLEKLVKSIDTAVQSSLSSIGLTVRAIESDAASLSEVSQSGRSRYISKRLHI